MNQVEQQKAAKEFSAFWKDKGDEKQESQRFWIGLLGDVFGVTSPAKYIEFEKRVQLTHTSYIDAYIADTKVLIEQKGIKIDLHKAYEQSDGTVLTPFEQAKRYADELPNSIRPRWIVVCNFAEFLVYDLENPQSQPEQIFLKDLPKEFYRLQFLVDQKNENIRREEEISIEAGKLVDKLYKALLPQYKNQDEISLRSLNILCVRIVFCLYAEDAGFFETRTAFEDYIRGFNLPNVRKGLIELFKALDTNIADRDEYDETLKPFPYVNGGLFKDENIEIPNFTQEIVDVIVNDCAVFDWAEISPTIFGAVFESTLNPETRRKGGMHYTSIQNIHKVIDPLFLDDLNAEFDAICKTASAKVRDENLLAFQKKLGSLKFLDPACGSGNFLTETYLSLRRLENKVISVLNKGETVLGFDEFIKVHINQFYGIEINDFAVTVAKTALWIAESQMIAETEAILSQNIDFLPLTTNAFIVEGNALRMDWSTLKPLEENPMPKDGLFSGFTTETDGTKHEYDYIMGKPPFVGYAYQSKEQKEDLHQISKDIANNIDYVAGWYFKAALLIKGTNTKAALVSTNSITQGEQVAVLWKPLFEQYDVKFDFAWRTFRWDSESTEKAHVHCVIVGFSNKDSNQKQKIIFDENGNSQIVTNINGYLLDAPTIFIDKNSKPLCDVPPMIRGSSPIDDGNFILTIEEKEEYIKKEPQGEKFMRPFMMGKDFIDRKPRFCFWLVGANPSEFRKCPILMNRIEAVRNFRLKSSKAATVQSAETPTIFGEMRPCESDYIAIPKVSSEQRRYIPMDYLPAEILAGDKLFQMPNASLYHFGVLTSNIHMAWMRAVCGRLEMRYSYSNTIVYNNFPWCNPTDEQKAKIEKTAQAILDARALFPDASLADLYDELGMPPELRKAHRENDKAVMAAYGFKPSMTESEIVSELFKMYEKMAK
ncbi:MAG: class I SAM-dependent DNA methyltransferase [Treponema sp.]|nr:class I SAM-dependent DNA methyltransferase [Treponema sp.]